MTGSNRRLRLAAVILPLLFMAMSGLARANDILVNTTSGESELAPLCSLPDAITAHNIHGTMNGCGPGTSSDRIFFAVTGTVSIDESLEITSGSLEIDGPIFGCSGAGPCGITIDGEGSVQIIRADAGTSVFLDALTLADGFGVTEAVNTGGGAVFTVGNDLAINHCLFVNNKAAGISTSIGGEGGAIYAGVAALGSVTIVNSTFANNTAVHGSSINSEGGAISADFDVLKITNSTFSGNSADVAGGIGFSGIGTVRLKNTILANNTGGNCGGTPTDLGGNISDDGTCAFTVAPFFNNTNPLLEPLANNGGPTDTFALETSSPAFGLLTLAQCTDQQSPTPQPVDTDQRLFARPDPYFPLGCDSGAYEVGALAPITAGTERVQVARSTSPNSDQVNIGLTFTYNGDPDCDLGPTGDEDALNFGVGVALVQGTCASLPDSGLFLNLFPFVVHTVNHQSYGTLFQTNGAETVSARMVALPTPAGSCGEWNLNLEVAGLNTGALGLTGSNPFALLISDFVDAESCIDINNAIVGNQLPKPSHSVRRGVRRQTRR
jgi:hypothetical protein